MEITNVKTLEKQAKQASKTVEATEKLIRDLQIQVSTVQDDDTLKQLETKIARLTYRLKIKIDARDHAQELLRRTKLDFQRFGEKNTL